MQRLLLDQDVRPLSEFRANAAALVQQVRDTRRPLVITQHGRSAAILLDVGEYEKLLDKIELLQDIRVAEQEVAEGKGVSHKAALRQALEKVKR
ncbi:MAG: type II toxin-antitoxin system Phd/YefM family antitoxin [Blastocatellia bacterium]